MQDPTGGTDNRLLAELVGYLVRPESVSGLLASLFGFFAAQAWSKWRSRMAEVRWTTTFTPIGESIQHSDLGEVKILWNGAEFHNVSVADIEFENESRHDLQAVELQVVAGQGCRFLGRGMSFGKPHLPWSARFQAAVDDLAADAADAEALQFTTSNRAFVVPIFNRREKFRVIQLIAAEAGEVVQVNVHCAHVGVKVVSRPMEAQLHGVAQRYTIRVGLLASATLAAAAAFYWSNTFVVGSIALILGLGAQSLAAGLVHAKRLVVRFLD